jgi:Cu/Ag efflux protein CusF
VKSDFLKYQAQTSPHPLALEIAKAEGSYIYDIHGKQYLDFIAGVSAVTLGHQHPKVIEAIKKQSVTLSHGPVRALKWPAMTMEFQFTKPGLLRGFKKGDKVDFRFVQKGSGSTIIGLKHRGKSK